jgi:hypothetical protein
MPNREIKVYMPDYLIGRLEEKKKAGIRSKFIVKAINARLNGEKDFDIWSCSEIEIYRMTRVWALKSNDDVLVAVMNSRLASLEVK